MRGKKGKSEKDKFADEINKIDKLTALNRVLKRSTIENALLTNATKETDSVSDSVIDSMLDNLKLEKESNRDIEIVEHLTTSKDNASITKKKKVRMKASGGVLKLKRALHLIKKRAPKKDGKRK